MPRFAVLPAALALTLAGAANAEDAVPAETPPAGPQLTLFEKTDFSGDEVDITGAVTKFPEIDFNDKAHSVRVVSGRWLVCEHSNYRGKCVILDASVEDLCVYRLEGRLSSAHPLQMETDGAAPVPLIAASASTVEAEDLYEAPPRQYSPRAWPQRTQPANNGSSS